MKERKSDTIRKGGYPSGDKLVTELKPPPSGPAPGAKPAPGSQRGSGKS